LFLTLVLLATAIVGLILGYTEGPYLWGKLVRGVIRHGDPTRSDIAITFDDGPDPSYTPRCLEILNAHRVHATFFLIGHKVKMYPDLARQILAQGHDVGSHTWSHQHHWMIGPLKAMREVRQANAELAAATGTIPRYFRPAYGIMNIFSYWQARRQRQHCVLWSVEGKDWEGGAGGRSAKTIADTISASLESGSIVLLHDSGGADGAPDTMLIALPEIISEAKRRGLRPVTIGEMLENKKNAG
jgi:peptidoglycan-N-acetylglucosamine deacetylase